LLFWFVPNLPEATQAHVAQDFFKELVSPQEFPRGQYIDFVPAVSSSFEVFILVFVIRLRGIHQENHEVDAEEIQRH